MTYLKGIRGMTAAERAARDIGTEHGRNAGTWVELDEDTAEAVDRDGVFDALDPYGAMTAPLSGEFADSYSVRDLSNDLGVDEDSDEFPDLADAYEQSYWTAFEREVERQVENMRGPTLDLDEDTRYLVGAGTVAWRYVGQTFGGRARLVMIGDDKEWTFDADEVRPAEGYCLECGQTGCYGGIRSDDDEER